LLYLDPVRGDCASIKIFDIGFPNTLSKSAWLGSAEVKRVHDLGHPC
jgi:hypothetical protein